jgi:hypothetical protein
MKIPVADAGRSLDGNLVLEVRLLGERRFPARGSWGD